MLNLFAVFTAATSLVAAIPSPYTLAPLYTPPAKSGISTDQSHLIDNSFIIVLEDHLEDHHIAEHHRLVESLHFDHHLASASNSNGNDNLFAGLVHKYSIGGKKAKSALKGYSGHFRGETIEAVRALKGVKYVERDSIVHTTEIERGAPWVRF
jgi:cerevisin